MTTDNKRKLFQTEQEFKFEVILFLTDKKKTF